MVSVTDCERVQTEWFRARAEAWGGSVLVDGGMLWTDGPDGLNVMFPERLDPAALRRGIGRAMDAGRDIVGVWLDTDVDTSGLAELGFERGWAPWWMTADLAEVPVVQDPRVQLDRGDHTVRSAKDLTTSTTLASRAWSASARLRPRGAPVGQAWSFLEGDLAGVFDMGVRPRYRRRGLGRGLLSAVCASARVGGARYAVLNATPDGEKLYRECGFRQIGEGITWWHHLRPTAP